MDESDKFGSPQSLQSPERFPLRADNGCNEYSRSLNAFAFDSPVSNSCDVKDSLSLNGSDILSPNDTKTASEMPLLLDNASTDELGETLESGTAGEVSVKKEVLVVNWIDFKVADLGGYSAEIPNEQPNSDGDQSLEHNECHDDKVEAYDVPEQSVDESNKLKCDNTVDVIQPAIFRNRPTRKACNPVLGRDFVDPTIRGHSKRTAVLDGSGDELSKSEDRMTRNEPAIKYPIGSLVWARISGHPWWPCMISKDLDGSNEYTRITGPRHSRRSSFVEFFGPTVEHAWIADNSLIEYKGMEEFKSFAQRKVDEAPKKVLKEKLVERFQLKVALSKRTSWEDAVKEADEMLDCSIEERLIWRAKKLEGLKTIARASADKSVLKDSSDLIHVPSTPRSGSPVQMKLDENSNSRETKVKVEVNSDIRNARVDRSSVRIGQKRLIVPTGRTSLPSQQKQSVTSLKAAAALSRRSQRIMSRKSSVSGRLAPLKHIPSTASSPTLVKRLACCTFCNAKFSKSQGPRDVAIHLLHCDKIKGSRMSHCPFCKLCFDKPKISDHQLKCHVQACSKQAHNHSHVAKTKARERSPSTDCEHNLRNEPKHVVKPQTSSRKLRSSTLQKKSVSSRKSSLRRPRLDSTRLDPSYCESPEPASGSNMEDPNESDATSRNRSNNERRTSNRAHKSSSRAAEDLANKSLNSKHAGSGANKTTVLEASQSADFHEGEEFTEESLPDSPQRKPKLRLIRRNAHEPQRSISFALCRSDDKIAEVSIEGDLSSAQPLSGSSVIRKPSLVASSRNQSSQSKDPEGEKARVRDPQQAARIRQVGDRRCSAIEALGKAECSAATVAARFGIQPEVVSADFYGDFASISHSAVMLGRLDLACCVIAEGTRASMAAICHRVPYKYLLMVIRGKSQDYAIEQFNADYEKWKLTLRQSKRNRESDGSDAGQPSACSKRQRMDADQSEFDDPSGVSEDPTAGEDDNVDRLLRQDTVAIDDQAEKADGSRDSEKADLASVELVKRENDYLPSDLHQTKMSKYYQMQMQAKVDWTGDYSTPARQHNENIRMLNTSLSAYNTHGFHAQDPNSDRSATEIVDLLSSEDETRIVNEVMAMHDKLWAFDYATNAATGIVLQKNPKSHGKSQAGAGREWWHFLLLKYPFLRKALILYFSQADLQQFGGAAHCPGDTASKKRSAA